MGMNAKLDLSKYAALEAAKAKREELIAAHAEELAQVEDEISREMQILGMGPYLPEGVKKQPKMAEVKRQQHAEIRQLAIQKGYFVQDGRKKGQPDVHRVRLEMKAEKMGISVATLIKRTEEERVKKALERVKLKSSFDTKLKELRALGKPKR
jgi:hypothetical protein